MNKCAVSCIQVRDSFSLKLDICTMRSNWMTAFVVTFVFAVGNTPAETGVCDSIPSRERTGNCPPIIENGTVLLTGYIHNCFKMCEATSDCQSFTMEMDHIICSLHECPYFQTSNELHSTYFRKICSGNSCNVEAEGKGLDANCTSSPVILNMSSDECLQACAQRNTCLALTLGKAASCFMFNCTTSTKADSTNIFYISECFGKLLAIISFYIETISTTFAVYFIQYIYFAFLYNTHNIRMLNVCLITFSILNNKIINKIWFPRLRILKYVVNCI
ncbi:uncharacterized protein LOC117336730 [Pecten maximus]|uniref:uncharacterized protein LOC117336730 n=1 Tax=Pecten maximus TaxID=6579 RepID=UPI0014584B9F|nr:uncharacterized protein LOC117336730 [Pecten maximus]